LQRDPVTDPPPDRPATQILALIDKLDELIHDAKRVPLTDDVRVNREKAYELLDQLRASLPEELKRARWIVREREEMFAEARRQAAQIVEDARREAPGGSTQL